MGAVNCKLASSWDVTLSVAAMNPLSSTAAKLHRGLWRFRHALGPLYEKNVFFGLGMFM